MEASKTPRSGRVLSILFVAVAVATALGFAFGGWLPRVATIHGKGIDGVTTYLLWTTGLLFLAGHGVLAWFVWRYSRSDGPVYRGVSRKTEWRWALVPILVMCVVAEGGVLLMGLPVWSQVYGVAAPDAVELEVVGKQFEWLVRYPGKDGKLGRTEASLVHDVRNPLGLDRKDPRAADDVVTRGVLHLPVRRQAVLRLRTHDVIHSFTIPQFRVKQDILPGFVAAARFEPVEEGEFEIACSELCGLGHYRMRGTVIVESEEAFEEWLSEQPGWFE